jgi:hypothetical protein
MCDMNIKQILISWVTLLKPESIWLKGFEMQENPLIGCERSASHCRRQSKVEELVTRRSKRETKFSPCSSAWASALLDQR